MIKIKNAICPGCTLLCDDIEFSPDDKAAKNACEIGQAFFQIENDSGSAKPEPVPSHSIDGKSASLDEAIKRSAEILTQSQAPLICGLDQMTTQAQQLAWKIADQIGATIDTNLSNHGRSSMFSLQRVGKVTASLGEIANRSDLILFWFCDPVSTHPRLLERLERLERISNTNSRRKIIVVDDRETATAKVADQFFKVETRDAPAVLAALRGKLAGLKLDFEHDSHTGKLLSMMKSANYGAIFYGQVGEDSAFDVSTDFLSQLIRRLNDETRFVSMKLRSDGNSQSAENVIAWSSGFPFAVSYAGKVPRYNWLEHSAETILTRGECDAILFATGSDLQKTFAGLSRTAKDFLGSIPKIVLSPIPDFQTDVAISVGVPGITELGEYCRNDDVSFGIGAIAGESETSSALALEKLLRELSKP